MVSVWVYIDGRKFIVGFNSNSMPNIIHERQLYITQMFSTTVKRWINTPYWHHTQPKALAPYKNDQTMVNRILKHATVVNNMQLSADRIAREMDLS